MHDILWQGIVSNGFWLLIFFGAVWFFRKQIKDLLGSLAGFKIANAAFEFGDRSATLKYNAILANMLVEILAQRESADRFYQFISDANAWQLVKFLRKYNEDVLEKDKDIEVLKNVALLVGRKRHYQVAIEVYDSLLKQYPDDYDLLYLKARMLRDSRIPTNLADSEAIFDKLITANPRDKGALFGRARSRSLRENFIGSREDLIKAFKNGYWRVELKMFEDEQLEPLREYDPEAFEELRVSLLAEIQDGGKGQA